MSYVYAGQYSEVAFLPNERFAKGAAVSVFLRGTSTLATLYSSRTKAGGAANPTTVDSLGNLTFFADPGSYDVSLNGGTFPVAVHADAAEVSSGLQIDYRNFDITADDDEFDSGPGLNALLAEARSNGGTAVLGPGIYYADETLVLNSIADQGAVGLRGESALGSLLGNKPVTIRRPIGSTHTMMTSLGRGVLLEGVTLDGQGTTGDGLVVSRGFEFSARDFRCVDIEGTAMDLRALSNSRLDRVFIDRCGTPGSGTDKPSLHVRGNSSYEYVTNTLWMSDVHIERSGGTAFNLAHGNNVDDLAEFIRCFGLHIEQNINNSSLTEFTTDPILKIGNVRGAWFYGTFIYGGSGPLVYYEKLEDNGGSAARGVKFFGGRLFGQVTNHAIDADTPDRLVDLVTGDNFEMHGMEFDTAMTELVRIGSGFGKEAFFPGCEFLTRSGATTTGITDSRTDTTSARGQMFMPGITADGSDSRFRSAAAGRVVSIDTPAAQAATLRFETAASSRWDIRKSSGAEAGSNAGSDLEIVRRSDAGANIATALTIVRSTGQVNIAAGLDVTGTTTLDAVAMSGGDVAISSAAGARIVSIETAAGQVGRLALRTATSDRWHINKNATAESGSDVGSDLEIASRTDAGASKTTVVTITRSTGRTAFGGDVQLNDKNLIFGTTTGTKIGTATSQKLAFYNAAPIIQPASTPAAATDLATALTLVNDLRTKLLALGLIA